VKMALEILHESEILRIEDIMEYFSDFVQIDEFKEEICSSLEFYNESIEQLKSEMNEYTKTAETLREEINEQDMKFDIVTADQRCDLCGRRVLGTKLENDAALSNNSWKALYVFPCTHSFHADCLLDEVSRHLKDDQRAHIDVFRRALEQQQRRIQQIEEGIEVRNTVTRSIEMSTAEREAESMLHDFLSAACPFCGDLMIESITDPLIATEEEEEALSWEL